MVENAKTIDVDWFRREGILGPHVRGFSPLIWRNPRTGQETNSVGYELQTEATAGWLRLNYVISGRSRGEPRRMDYRIELMTTRPHFGGVRWWFVCPLSGRKVRKLYLHPISDYFASRQALGLTYQSCRETVGGRAKRKAHKLLSRLGASAPADDVEFLPKPKGMHWTTFDRLREAAVAARERSLQYWVASTLRQFPRLREELERLHEVR